jgi:flagellar basal-body rod protein FlgF
MESPIYVALSRQTALARQLDVIANNVANSSTTGFKRQGVMFNEFLERSDRTQKVSFVQDRAVIRDLTVGAFSPTDNPLDFAINGSGYFTVDTASGRRYTRAGNFQLSDRREVVTQDGLPVLDDHGQPMVIPEGAKEIRLAGDGTLSTDQGEIGSFGIASFQQEQLMTEVGGGLYSTDETPQGKPDGTRIAQGMLEQSNVSPIVETTQMIDLLRQYQMNQNLISAEHERIRNAARSLAKTVS